MQVNSNYAPARRAGALQGLTLLLPCTLSVMGVLVLAPVLPQLMAEFKTVPGALFWVPTILTTPALCIALFSPVAGYLGDRIGRRRLLIVASIIYAFLGMAPILLDNLFAILATRVGVGICESIVLTLSTTLISDFFEGKQRNKWLALQTAVASISALVFLTVGGYLGSIFGWRGPFFVYGSSLILAVGLMLFTWEPGKSAAEDTSIPAGWKDFPWLRMAGICAVTIVGSVMFYTIQIQMSVALVAQGVHDTARIGLLTALASLGIPCGTFVFMRFSRLPTAFLLTMAFTLIGVTFVCMSHAGNITMFLIASALNQLGAGMVLPTLLTWAVKGLPFEIRGRGTGIWQATFSVGQFITGFAVPIIALRMGGIVPAFQVLGGVALASGIVAIFLALRVTALRRPCLETNV